MGNGFRVGVWDTLREATLLIDRPYSIKDFLLRLESIRNMLTGSLNSYAPVPESRNANALGHNSAGNSLDCFWGLDLSA